MQDVEQQPGNEEAAMPSENENANVFQNSVAAKGGEKETHESSGDSQNFQFTPGEVNQSQDITDAYADDAEHRSTHTLSLKDVDLWKELSYEEITYRIVRAVLRFSTVMDHLLVPSEGRRSNPGFAQKLCFFQRKSMVKHIAESG